MTRTELFDLIKVKVEEVNVDIDKDGFEDTVNEFIDWYFIGNGREFKFEKKQRDIFLFYVVNKERVYILK
jgi:hypothetical protein